MFHISLVFLLAWLWLAGFQSDQWGKIIIFKPIWLKFDKNVPNFLLARLLACKKKNKRKKISLWLFSKSNSRVFGKLLKTILGVTICHINNFQKKNYLITGSSLSQQVILGMKKKEKRNYILSAAYFIILWQVSGT